MANWHSLLPPSSCIEERCLFFPLRPTASTAPFLLLEHRSSSEHSRLQLCGSSPVSLRDRCTLTFEDSIAKMATMVQTSSLTRSPLAAIRGSPADLRAGAGQRLNLGLPSRRGLAIRAVQQQDKDTPLPQTKVDITEQDVKKNEGQEPLRVFDGSPAAQFFRPESERRPELGNTSVESVMKFDGPAPETINSRLSMLGITWAFIAELLTGQSVVQQVTESNGLLWFLAAAPIVVWASFIPIFGSGESPDSRAAGPFNAKAERWNGRAAMIGFVSLIVTEQFLLHGPLLGFLHSS